MICPMIFDELPPLQSADKQMKTLYNAPLKHSLDKRIGMQLNCDEFSDCTFTFPPDEQKNIKAHRMILAAVSPVFKTMLSQPWGVFGQNISIEEIEYDTFYDLLKFCYSDKLDIKNCKHAVNLLYAFKKYMMDEAAKICRQYILKEVCIDDAVEIFLMCDDRIKEDDLRMKIVQYICQYPATILKNNLNIVNAALWRYVLSEDRINMSEYCLMKLIQEWVVLTSVKATPESCRKILLETKILEQLRFLSLDVFDESEQWLAYLLNKDDLTSIIRHRNKETFNNDYYLCSIRKPREARPCNTMTCMRTLEYTLPHLHVKRATCLQVKVRSEKTILLRGIIIPTRTLPDCNVTYACLPNYNEDLKWSLTMDNKESDYDAAGTYNSQVKKILPYDSTTDVYLDKPYKLNRGVWYVFQFEWENIFPLTLYRPDHRSISTHAGVKIIFSDDNGQSFLLGLKYNI